MSTDEKEKSSSEAIANAKHAIKKIFAEIELNGDSYKRYPELEKGKEIDVENYLCSVCGLEDGPRNDILFCDKAGCNRVYHQKCLDPPILSINSLDDEDDWFCPICDCIEDCLEMVNEAFETSFIDWRQVFPEVDTAQNDVDFEESDDEEDGSYAPSSDDDSASVESESVDSRSAASEASNDDDNMSTIEEEEVHHLLRETGGGEVDHRIRRRSKPEVIDVFSQLETPQDLVSQYVAKSIKGYLLRGQVISYSPDPSISSANGQMCSYESNVPLGWDGAWTVQYEYEKNPCQVRFQQLKNALELYLEYSKKIQAQDESKMRHSNVSRQYLF